MTKNRRRTTKRARPTQLTTDFTFFPLWSPRAYAYALDNFVDFEGAGHDFYQFMAKLSVEVERVLYADGVPVLIPLEADEYVKWLADNPALADSSDTRTAFAMEESLEYAFFIEDIKSFYTVAESEMLNSYAVEMVVAETELLTESDADVVFENAITRSEQLTDELLVRISERAPEEVSVEYLAFIEFDDKTDKMSGVIKLYADSDGDTLRFEVPEDELLLDDVLLVGTVNRCRLIVTCYENGSFGTKFRWKVDHGSSSDFVALPFS